MTVHAKTCINPVRMPMHLFHQETQVNTPRCEHECRRTHSPMALCFFQSHLGVFFRAHLGFFAAHSLQMQAQTSLHFFRMYLTFGKNRSLLLAEQEFGPNSFITDIEVVTLPPAISLPAQKATLDFLIHMSKTFQGIESGISISGNFAEAHVYFVNIIEVKIIKCTCNRGIMVVFR